MITPNIYLSQAQTLKLHVNLSQSHHQCRVTPLQRLTVTIQQLKIFPKRNLITLEAVNTTYAPIPILIIRDIQILTCPKFYFEPLFACHFCSLFYLLHTHHSLHFSLSFWGTYKITKNINKAKFTQQRNSKLINKYNSFN